MLHSIPTPAGQGRRRKRCLAGTVRQRGKRLIHALPWESLKRIRHISESTFFQALHSERNSVQSAASKRRSSRLTCLTALQRRDIVGLQLQGVGKLYIGLRSSAENSCAMFCLLGPAVPCSLLSSGFQQMQAHVIRIGRATWKEGRPSPRGHTPGGPSQSAFVPRVKGMKSTA